MLHYEGNTKEELEKKDTIEQRQEPIVDSVAALELNGIGVMSEGRTVPPGLEFSVSLLFLFQPRARIKRGRLTRHGNERRE